MRIFVIHSTRYYKQVILYKEEKEREGHEVYLPCLDTDQTRNALEICEANRAGIEWCDEVHCFYDGNSHGVLFDTGMAFMLRKPFRLIHLNSKSFNGLLKQYEESSR